MSLFDIDGHILRKKGRIDPAEFERCRVRDCDAAIPNLKTKAVTHYSFNLLLKTESRLQIVDS